MIDNGWMVNDKASWLCLHSEVNSLDLPDLPSGILCDCFVFGWRLSLVLFVARFCNCLTEILFAWFWFHEEVTGKSPAGLPGSKTENEWFSFVLAPAFLSAGCIFVSSLFGWDWGLAVDLWLSLKRVDPRRLVCLSLYPKGGPAWDSEANSI